MQYLITGGGIIGMMTALMLRQQGADVTLIDRQLAGRESTWAGGGIVSPLYPWRYPESVTRLASRSQALYPELTDYLLETSGIDPEYLISGMLTIAPDEEQDALQWATKNHKQLSRIPKDEISELEPEFAPDTESAIWMPDVAQVRNPRIAKSMRETIIRLGVELLEEHELHGLVTDSGKVTGVETSKGILHADNIILCTGAWTAQLVSLFSDLIPVIEPVRGQMILFKTAPDLIKHITLWEDRYAIPRKDGRILFGSTVEYSGFIKQTTEDAEAELYDVVTNRYPILKEYEVELQWAGLRPGSPSGVPYIARHPEYENLYINAGHFRNGVVLAPASCELMLKLLAGTADESESHDYMLEAERS
ncbi:glycine oxidase ThiO [Solemya velum gill symbiont]|uniref:Glycine oxidase ThiO n=1 Tax=Solemya velum gill symbiont TaxID=2340 RepID=A0A0B0H605_SOVGS|nr:glycine oxidase ThiO [Solemya velum gill symbiont]KHF24540.1 glycine oxidase ThiO [Solemya velum gill symbiont]OOY35304.1 glycine oxidase ThiO [Solemya velum gill symbiont]OOY38105.1 glycine oxidase ThiO [Solemya velum gill symbiont]OOY39004.1 glycine oxidase ThiO [Solemya velum gill symbiont]OOY44130.1 glycine oxidase ThiO [Solemya velum gill symbiont]